MLPPLTRQDGAASLHEVARAEGVKQQRWSPLQEERSSPPVRLRPAVASEALADTRASERIARAASRVASAAEGCDASESAHQRCLRPYVSMRRCTVRQRETLRMHQRAEGEEMRWQLHEWDSNSSRGATATSEQQRQVSNAPTQQCSSRRSHRTAIVPPHATHGSNGDSICHSVLRNYCHATQVTPPLVGSSGHWLRMAILGIPGEQLQSHTSLIALPRPSSHWRLLLCSMGVVTSAPLQLSLRPPVARSSSDAPFSHPHRLPLCSLIVRTPSAASWRRSIWPPSSSLPAAVSVAHT